MSRLRAVALFWAGLLVAAPTAQAAPPTVTAPSAAVIEVSTGTVVFAKNADQKRGMASTTKLMTALVALDEKPLSTVMTAIDYGGSAAETRIGLVGGEKMTLADLVRAMMLPSANDAAQTVAVRTSGSKAAFIAQMNAKAAELGLKRTHFTNSIGLDAPTHKTTAAELAKIGAAAYANPFIRQTVRRPRITLASGGVPRTLVNRNRVLGTELGDGAVINGMKTGHTTSSGYALVGSATRNGVTVVSAVLGDPSEAARDADTVKLLRWASQLFVKRQIVKARTDVTTVGVVDGKAETVAAITPASLTRTVPRNAKVALDPTSMSATLEAPVARGTRVGVADVSVNGEVVDRIPLVTGSAVERKSAVALLLADVGRHWKGTLLALLLVLGGSLTIVKARRGGSRHTSPGTSVPGEPTERTTAP